MLRDDIAEAIGFERPTIAWLGDHVYYCGHDGNGAGGILTRTSLITGAVEKAYLYCNGVSVHDGRLVVLEEASLGRDELVVYEDFWSAQCGEPEARWGSISDTRYSVGDAVYTAWHSTDTINVRAIETLASGPSVTLEGYDDWITASRTFPKES